MLLNSKLDKSEFILFIYVYINLYKMKRLFLLFALVSISLSLLSQKADFKSAEKFRSSNLSTKVGDLSVRANWIHESNKFWYSYKTSAG